MTCLLRAGNSGRGQYNGVVISRALIYFVGRRGEVAGREACIWLSPDSNFLRSRTDVYTYLSLPLSSCLFYFYSYHLRRVPGQEAGYLDRNFVGLDKKKMKKETKEKSNATLINSIGNSDYYIDVCRAGGFDVSSTEDGRVGTDPRRPHGGGKIFYIRFFLSWWSPCCHALDSQYSIRWGLPCRCGGCYKYLYLLYPLRLTRLGVQPGGEGGTRC